MPPDSERRSPASELYAAIPRLTGAMLKLDPGALARLRRMDVHGPGEADFWRLAVNFGLPATETGMRFVKILALLAPKGEPSRRPPFHDRSRPLGEALCDAELSEARLARFLTLPTEERGAALESLARLLSAKLDPGRGVNCMDIARLLFSSNVQHARQLAQTYYRRLDQHEAKSEKDSAA